MKNVSAVIAASVWALGLSACVVATVPPPPPEEPPTGSTNPGSTTAPPPVTDAGPGDPAGHHECRLPAPKKSDDVCKADADCAPSDPCHAAACVAKAKAHPKTPDTVCTMMLACDTADANRCGCFEGRCALVPPAATKE